MNGLHIELTSKCTLKCPKCPRTYSPGLKIEELPFEIFSLAVRGPWDRILLCGNHGDPIYYSRFHEILEHIRSLTYQPSIFIESNGSFRSRDWWLKTAALLRPDDVFSFSIDGLQDTNGLYRQGADWPSIVEGIQTLKANSRCRLLWKYIVFRHNQHQVLSAFQQAREWNMAFKLVESTRFELADLLRPTLSFAELNGMIHDHAQM